MIELISSAFNLWAAVYFFKVIRKIRRLEESLIMSVVGSAEVSTADLMRKTGINVGRIHILCTDLEKRGILTSRFMEGGAERGFRDKRLVSRTER